MNNIINIYTVMTRVVTVNVSDELYKRLENISNLEERSKSFFIKKGLEKVLAEREKANQKKFIATAKLIREKAKEKGLNKEATKLLKELGFDE